MLDLQFFGLNLHFALNLLAALVCFAVFWLVLDAWSARRRFTTLLSWGGFLVLAIGFLVRAATLQSDATQLANTISTTADITRLVGYLLVILGQAFDPLQKRPTYNTNDPLQGLLSQADSESPRTTPPPPSPPSKTSQKNHGLALAIAPALAIALPASAFIAAILYWRRTTIGYERHLKTASWAFTSFTLFEAITSLEIYSTTTNPILYRLLQQYGLQWWLSLGLLALSIAILGSWVWQYLVKRLQSQLFIIMIGSTITLFLASTIGFTFLLLQNIRSQSLTDLATASRVLDYAISSRRAEIAATAEGLAASSSVVAGAASGDHKALVNPLGDYLTDHQVTSLVITDAAARVLWRGEDPDRHGDSRSSDPLVRRALVGEASSSVTVRDGAAAPTVTLVAAHPIRDAADRIIGTVVIGRVISNAFVDGIRTSTGLESTVYGGNIRAATTLVATDSADRALGLRETSQTINTQVLKSGQDYSGTIQLQNRSYLAAFAPLKDINNTPIGMVMVAKPLDALYAAANRSVQLTYLLAIALIVLSIYPVYRIARFISRQL